ncbi:MULTISPECIES: VirD4-like conjugal transfer protein, CD1115 family [unclassified Acetobacterium]|uniref:VirD4-like conjugal transfer protein, CD1115 family n=1 Tax=unclassified Acetobacterium TaxID=2638182 RepID=UPI001FA8B182|nr:MULTISPECIES: type IV secretory system conjugative DNA transfer family protein [unclassified Acetobacterium]MDZ5726384.1 type IV secretory system conjugative DNA transfer family protein [Acetobacterium sp. K1/6]
MRLKIVRGLMAVFVFVLLAIGSLFFIRTIDGFMTGQGILPFNVPLKEVFDAVVVSENTFHMYLLCLAFALFMAVAFFIGQSKTYKSELISITPDIQTPRPAGQNQHGSARWLDPNKKDRAFDYVIIRKNNPFIQFLLRSGKEERRQIKKDNYWVDKTIMENKKNFKMGGLVLGKDRQGLRNEKIYFIGEDVHGLIIGATRCGKGRTVILQTIGLLAMARESQIVSDPKGENYDYTAPFLRKCGVDVFALDFKDPLKSNHYNFLQSIIDAVKTGNMSQAIDYVWDITGMLVGEPKGERLWSNGEASIIASCIMIVVFENMDNPEYQNLTNVFYFIAEMCKAPKQADEMMLAKYMKKLKVENPTHPALGLVAISDIAPSKTKGSFYTSALTTLKLFTNPLIYEMTRKTDFRPKDIGSRPTAVFIILPDGKTTYYSLAALFCTQVYSALSDFADKLGGRLPVRVNYELDEFGNFTKIPDFTAQISVGGGRGIRYNLFLQSMAQLEEKYGREIARIIRSNCETWIYLKAEDLETQKEVSERLGKYTTTSYSLSSSQQHYTTNSSQSVNLVGRELLTANEISRIRRPYNLVTSRNDPAIMTSPDLGKWSFNDFYGLGSKEHNRVLRMIRSDARPTHQEHGIQLWGIWKRYQI